jgi:hypothetical protein
MPIGSIVSLPISRLLDIDGCWQRGDFFYQPEVFWARNIWERSGSQLDESLYYSMDYELWVRMASSGAQLIHIPDPLAIYRMHEQQKTYGNDPPFISELRSVSARWQNYMATKADC